MISQEGLCIYMHPVHAGSHRLLVVDSLESRSLRFIHLKLKPERRILTPMNVVGRLSARAERERAVYVSGQR